MPSAPTMRQRRGEVSAGRDAQCAFEPEAMHKRKPAVGVSCAGALCGKSSQAS